ncbi:hypothetical protein COOONC_02030 [Cooperia oncophora]
MNATLIDRSYSTAHPRGQELRAEETKEHFSHDELIRVLVEEGALKRSEDDRTLSQLLSSARQGSGSVTDSPMCGPSDTSTPQRANPSQRQGQNEFVLDKVGELFGIYVFKINTYWAEGLDKETRKLLGDRFGLEGVKDVVSLEDKSLLDLVNEVTEIVQGASLLLIQSDTNVKVKWMYELASDASHCGFDSVRLSVFKWSDTKDMDVYEKKLFNAKGKDLEGAICASTICRDGLACECLLPRGVGKLRAGVQPELSVSIPMQPGGIVETTPVQNEAAGCVKTEHQPDGRLQLVTDENAVFGNITKFLSVEMYTGGHVYAVVSHRFWNSFTVFL